MQQPASHDPDGAPARHVAIIGEGALGSVYGARMATVPGSVSFVVRPDRATLDAPIELQRVGSSDRICLRSPRRLSRLPPDATIVALAVRADNLDAQLEACLRDGPSVPVISLTPLMPSALDRLRDMLGARLVVAMPGVVAYAVSPGVIRYWLPRLAPTLLDDRAVHEPQAEGFVRWLNDAGIPARVHPGVDTMNPATTMTFLPLVMLLDAAGGTVDGALQRPGLLKLALEAVKECRAVADRVGEVPRWAGLLGRFVGPRALRVGAALAQRSFPESVTFVQRHFGSKTHAQNVLLAREVLAVGSRCRIDMPHTARLASRCAARSEEDHSNA